MKINFFLLLLSVFTLVSCQNSEPNPFGVQFNIERKKVGLRIIDNTLPKPEGNNYDRVNKIYYPVTMRVKNVSLFEGIKKPAYCEKLTFLNPKNGDLIFEEDVFASGIKKPSVDTDINEVLVYRYVFNKYEQKAFVSSSYSFYDKIHKNGKSFKNDWQYIYVYPDIPKGVSVKSKVTFFEQKMEYISKEKADSILTSWKIKRLNY